MPRAALGQIICAIEWLSPLSAGRLHLHLRVLSGRRTRGGDTFPSTEGLPDQKDDRLVEARKTHHPEGCDDKGRRAGGVSLPKDADRRRGGWGPELSRLHQRCDSGGIHSAQFWVNMNIPRIEFWFGWLLASNGDVTSSVVFAEERKICRQQHTNATGSKSYLL